MGPGLAVLQSECFSTAPGMFVSVTVGTCCMHFVHITLASDERLLASAPWLYVQARLSLLLMSTTVVLSVCTVSDRCSKQSWHALNLSRRHFQPTLFIAYLCWPMVVLKDLDYISWPTSPFARYTGFSSGLCTIGAVFELMDAAYGLVLAEQWQPS